MASRKKTPGAKSEVLISRPRRDVRAEEKKRAKLKFIEELCRHSNVAEATRRTMHLFSRAETMISARNRYYEERERDPEFAAAWDKAVEIGTEGLEQEAWRRAKKGVKKPVFYKGEQVAAVKEYSDVLLMFLLKGRKPHVYRDRYEVTGANGQPVLAGVMMVPAPATPEQWTAMVAAQNAEDDKEKKK